MNQEPQILDYKNFDYNRLEYYDPLKSRGGSYVANINYKKHNDDSIPIYIQTPRLKVVNGIITTTKKTYIELELDSSDKSNMEFYNFLTKFDEINLRTCHQRSKNWFGVQFPLDDIDGSYNGLIKANRSRSPSIKINLQVIRGNIITEIYTDKKQSTNSSYVAPGDYVIGIIEIDGLRFSKTKFIFDMSISQIKVYKDEVKGKLTGYHIREEQIDPVVFSPSKNNENHISDTEEQLDNLNDNNIEVMTSLNNNIDINVEYSLNDNEPEEEQLILNETNIIDDNEVDVIQHNEVDEIQHNEVDEIQYNEVDDNQTNEVDEIQNNEVDEIQNNEVNEIQNNEVDDNQNYNNQNDDEEPNKLLETIIEPEDKMQSTKDNEVSEVQKDNYNDFVLNKSSKISQYYENIDDLVPTELNNVNFGIDNNLYNEQVNHLKDDLRNLINRYDDHKSNYETEIKHYQNNIKDTTDKYRELCHRYNMTPEF